MTQRSYASHPLGGTFCVLSDGLECDLFCRTLEHSRAPRNVPMDGSTIFRQGCSQEQEAAHFFQFRAVHDDVCSVHHALRLPFPSIPCAPKVLEFTAGTNKGINVTSESQVEDWSATNYDGGLIV
ncbi:hypothetical protein DPMN_123333 [Dreissena polymorpha]|uniref:Uncharacterized protein n=1 Tax=Dreissena polymorpha TaxID=45954 RepID=A0A9D4JSS7_DREPO|nr:hypothetical protein DPMN_123333 [Dreissena polymorpha]